MSTDMSPSDRNTPNSDPTISKTNPTTLNTNSTAPNTNSTASSTDPTASNTDPTCMPNTNPPMSNTNPTTSSTDPSALNTDPSALNTDPSALNTDPSISNTNPPVTDPGQAISSPSQIKNARSILLVLSTGETVPDHLNHVLPNGEDQQEWKIPAAECALSKSMSDDILNPLLDAAATDPTWRETLTLINDREPGEDDTTTLALLNEWLDNAQQALKTSIESCPDVDTVSPPHSITSNTTLQDINTSTSLDADKDSVMTASGTSKPSADPAAKRVHKKPAASFYKDFDDLELEAIREDELNKKLGWDKLSEESYQEKVKVFASFRKRISDFYQSETRHVKKNPVEKFLQDVNPTPKPSRTNDVLVFMCEFWDRFVKQDALNAIAEAEAEYQELVQNGGIYEEQSKEFHGHIKKMADKEHAQKMAEWEEEKSKEEVEKDTPESYALAIQKWAPAVAQFNSSVSQEMGLILVTAAVGPNPDAGGKIDVFWNHTGKNTMGQDWSEFDPAGYHAANASLVKFGKSAYSKSESTARALPSTVPKLWPSSSTAGTDPAGSITKPKLNATQKPASSPAHKTHPGPGRNSKGALINKQKGKGKGKMAQVSESDTAESSEDTSESDEPAAKSTGIIKASAPTFPQCQASDSTPSTLVTHHDNQTEMPSQSQALTHDTSDGASSVKEAGMSSVNHTSTHQSASDAAQGIEFELEKFWNPLARTIKFWAVKFGKLPDEDWIEIFKNMLETYIEIESHFQFARKNEKIESSVEWEDMALWDQRGGPSQFEMEGPPELRLSLVKELETWWKDISDFEDTSDMAPLDCVSGIDELFRLISAVVCVLFFIFGDRMDGRWQIDQRQALAEWSMLVKNMDEILTKVYEHGKFKRT
ncbi:hypothetical protein K435DRAFT_868346 [Dendrothele bispora CBS 962.96]|uniref:Uncharacterized protein n=1 Tax=Dendrothele bispora (strain CBS 962.96) TaxID=1314807 RepID=A0A4S8LCN5_DENBC|nr:hypothetical protein K435DRAFT_868346 [Dendrothele bispora CBS 962.96]